MELNQQQPEQMEKHKKWNKRIGSDFEHSSTHCTDGTLQGTWWAFFLVSMPITDEITCGDGCFCVGEKASIIKRMNDIEIIVIRTIWDHKPLHKTEVVHRHLNISTSFTGTQKLLKQQGNQQ